MKDATKYLLAGAAGAAAMAFYKGYQDDQARAARRARGPVERLTNFVQDTGFLSSGQVNGLGGHMAVSLPKPQARAQRVHAQRHAPQAPTTAGFYGNNGMRQSGAGNPHAPVVVPSRRHGAPPPPPQPMAASDGGGGEYEQYSDDNSMGGQTF